MKQLLCIVLLSGILKIAHPQNGARVDSFSQILSPIVKDSLGRLLSASKEDSNRVYLLHRLSYPTLFSRPDSALNLVQEGLKLARQINYKKGEALCKTDIGSVWWIIGDYSKANEEFLEGLRLSESLGDAEALEWTLSFLASNERDQGNFHEALGYCFRGAFSHSFFSQRFWNVVTGSIYQEMDKPDSALVYLQQGDAGSYNYLMLGHAYKKIGKKMLALDYYNKSVAKHSYENNLKDLADAYIGLAELYEKDNKIDSSIHFAKKGFALAQNSSFKKWVYETGLILSRLYETEDASKALYYHKLAMAAKDSMFNVQAITQSLNTRFTEQLRQQQIQSEKINYRNRVRTYVLLGAIGVFILLAIILWRNNRQKQRARLQVEHAYEKLKSAQAQLIQSEKMASLGELTAGIAHEIQNPLNFVNNFSDVNKELVDELKSELASGNIKSATDIAETIKDNEDKINQHGKRADAIVKGMLQHSRSSSGQKELTDINALAEEYLRLAYHGLRAKDKTFNAKFETNLDPAIGKINIVPQEVGRVILNLVNNAFYSVSTKALATAAGGYEPTVIISTKKATDKIEIKVSDNGIGIPQKLLDKIFQPFFTTKPTGQGTGLGLSLAYDIITKGHGGKISVVTSEGSGSEFIIDLPLS
jgi:signal transduction histidine kinase